MGRKTEPHNLPTCPVAANFWYDKTSNWASSYCISEYIPRKRIVKEKDIKTPKEH